MSVRPTDLAARSPMRSPRLASNLAAAAHRLAVLHELEEGIDNHFTDDRAGQRRSQYLILPFGLHWSEARASDLIVFDEAGRDARRRASVVEPRRSASTRRSTASRARVVAAHAPDLGASRSTCCRTTGSLPASQTAAFFSRPDRLRRRLHRHRRRRSRKASAWRGLMAASRSSS